MQYFAFPMPNASEPGEQFDPFIAHLFKIKNLCDRTHNKRDNRAIFREIQHWFERDISGYQINGIYLYYKMAEAV